MDRAGAQEVGGYRLDRLIGRGAMSEVWRAERVGDRGAAVAIKRGSHLHAEAEALMALDHPNVVALIEMVADGAGVALVMPLAECGSLDALLARRGRLPAEEVVAIVGALADGLAHAHGRGVVHGDVKPANVLMGTDGVPLLSDFGARGPELVGTEAFMDPQRPDTGRAAPSRDVYALGVVAYLALTGRLPHTDHRPLREERDVPARLASVVEAALSPQVLDRPQSAGHLAAALRASVAGGHVTRTFGPRPVHAPPTAAPARRRVAAGVVVALAMVGVVGAPVAVGVIAPRHAGCDAIAPLAVPAGGRALRADVRGDGCPVPVVWDGRALQVRLGAGAAPRRYVFIAAGGPSRSGSLLVGDWDCDGAESPAFYDRASGEIHYFALEASSGALTARGRDLTGIGRGRVHVGRGRDGCDRVEVEPA